LILVVTLPRFVKGSFETFNVSKLPFTKIKDLDPARNVR